MALFILCFFILVVHLFNATINNSDEEKNHFFGFKKISFFSFVKCDDVLRNPRLAFVPQPRFNLGLTMLLL